MAPKRKAPEADATPAVEDPPAANGTSDRAKDPESKGGKTKQTPQGDEHIEIHIQPQQPGESGEDKTVTYRVRAKVKLEKIFEKFCAKLGHEMKAVRFQKDGTKLKKDKTLLEAGLKDGDVIDALTVQDGGASR